MLIGVKILFGALSINAFMHLIFLTVGIADEYVVYVIVFFEK